MAFKQRRALLILMGLTGNIDVPGGNVLWVPPRGIRPKSPLIDRSVAGEQFLPPEKKERILTGGKYPFAPNCHPPTFWKSVVTGDPYRVRGIWIVGSNPLVTGTQGLTIEKALRDHMEYTVVSELFMTPTAQLADLVLPAAHWLEQDDVVYLHKIWCVLSRKKLAQVGETRDDRDVIFDVAHRLGLTEAFPWPDRHAYLDWLVEETGMSFEEFKEKDILVGEMRYRKHESDGFPTPTGKFEFYSNVMEHEGRPPLPVYVEPPLSPVATPDVFRELPLYSHERDQEAGILSLGDAPGRLSAQETSRPHCGDPSGDCGAPRHFRRRLGLSGDRPTAAPGSEPGFSTASRRTWSTPIMGGCYPEAPPPDYGWKESCANLLYGDDQFDPDTGAEPLKCYLCNVSRA